MTGNYAGLRTSQRKDFYDVLADLPKLPEGVVIAEPHSASNPIAMDPKTGVYYKLNNSKWEIADKE